MRISIVLLCMLLIYANSLVFNWTKPDKENNGLPPTIQIYKLKTTNSPFKTNLTGAFVRVDFTNKNLEFKVGHNETEKSKTPMQWAAFDENVVYAVLNGGHFNVAKNISESFICSDSYVYHQNKINTVKNKIYPTLGSIGVLPDGKFDIQWIYSFNSTFKTYAFPHPNPYPGPAPIPSNGKYWNVKQGLGAGPILVKNRTLIKGNPQNFGVKKDFGARNPRSGVCYDQAGRLILVAIDGRYSGSAGLTDQEFGILLQDLGCVDALNLDGGGSTLLYGNNQILNRYSGTAPRPVISAIIIRDKYKKKISNSHKK